MAGMPPQRVLIVRNDRLGDTILTLPVIAALKQALPDTFCAVLVDAALWPLVRHVPIADAWLADDGRSSWWQLGETLRPHHFDAALVLYPKTRNVLATWRAGIPRRVTWAGKLASRLLGTAPVHVHRSRPPIHETAFGMKFVERLVGDVPPTPPAPLPDFPPAVRQSVAGRLAAWRADARPCWIVHPGNRGSAFNWPPYRYAELVRELDRFATVLVSGTRSEESLVREVRRMAGDRGIPVVGWSLLEFAHLVAQVDGIVVSSTGPMHLAGWLGTRSVALFSHHPAHSPLKWAPLGDRHTIIQPALAGGVQHVLSEKPEQMEQIDVEAVLRAVLRQVRREADEAA